ncbi:hypothetical protein R6Q59_003119 [Mikania micrantha]
MEAGDKGKALLDFMKTLDVEERNTMTMEAGDKGKALVNFDDNDKISMEAGEDGLRCCGVDENGKKRVYYGSTYWFDKNFVFESLNGTRYWKLDAISDEKPTIDESLSSRWPNRKLGSPHPMLKEFECQSFLPRTLK